MNTRARRKHYSSSTPRMHSIVSMALMEVDSPPLHIRKRTGETEERLANSSLPQGEQSYTRIFYNAAMPGT
ncbi:hypothetical protein M513_04387 [Trichuris suis]|uniref:Uncharacterized protein n=1 Tax=Trichuris suis TaxID=68888 RepID=A0A085MBU1_9BILA|nr:hypothetical protein M513_04387 [Trichuris suis]